MIYQCMKCRKVYSKEELIDYLIKINQVNNLAPICPNCKSKKVTEYNLVKIK